LKHRYGADAAYMVIVAANGNFTAGLRAHAYIGGPLAVLDTSYGHETFMHEFGHIFGAYDEYCPDACSAPTSIQGYLGVYNANAYFQEGGPGIDNGKGEGAPSLMQYNQPGAVNGYTRGAWGWIDSDGDGIVEVRDTFPKSALTATVSGNQVRVTGTITDRGASRTFGNVRYSANRIVALEYAFDANGPWFPIALAADTRGRQAVDVELGTVPAGTRSIFVRGVNSVGNVEPRAQELRVTTTTTGNTAPYVRLDAPARAGTAAPVTLVTTALDLEGSATQVRYDVDGDGTWDTTYRAPGAFSTTLPAGLRTVKVQVKDAAGLTRVASAEIAVVSGAMAPVLSLSNLPSLVHGVTPANVAMTATAPSAAALDVVTELATDDDSYVVKGSAGADGSVMASLPTPISLKTTKLDLTAGDPALQAGWIRDIVALDADHVAVASGSHGIWILDISDRSAPRVMSTLVLETSANRLFKHGSRLYVLGTYLTVVDLRDYTAPREWKQLVPVNATVSMQSEEVLDIPDAEGWGVTHFYGFGQGAKITAARVTVTVDHPRLADLVIRLVPAKGSGIEPIVLRDHVPGGGGLRTFTYATTSNAALRAVIGQFADDYWTVEVTDDVGNHQAGRLVSSRIEFKTSAKAVDVIDNATEVAGLTSWGDLVIAGAGVEVLDVTLPQWITSLSRISGTATQGATMVGDTAVVSMALEAKSKDPNVVLTPTLRGLCAVDLRSSFFPRVLRCEKELGGQIGEYASVAGRLYQGIQPVCDRDEGCNGGEPFTIVGDLSAFARNRAAWQLGSTPLRVDHFAFGDARSIWTIGFSGAVQELDVTSPTAVSVRKSYPRDWAARLVELRSPEVMLFDYSPQARIARLGEEQSILSRVYRITVAARTAAGDVTRVSRTVHVVPYDHAPAVLSATVGRRDDAEPWRLTVTANDGDRGATWDPSLFARVDFDADGVFDTDWAWMGNDGTGVWSGVIELSGVEPGAYPAAVVEVRDGFWAQNRATFTLTIP
jgi:subtilisin-like proprotein convertase family protein